MNKIQKTILFVLILFVSNLQAGTLFRLPLASNPGYNAWFDHDSTGNNKKRYDCATNFEYDAHTGTDFATSIGTLVYAGASGELYYTVDGCPDGSSPSCGSSYGNHVRIKHKDGLVSIYAHLKKGSVAGQKSILCGGKVGLSGNSGETTGPHMHFELWSNSSADKRLDFYSGSCNKTGYWVDQNKGWPKTVCQK